MASLPMRRTCWLPPLAALGALLAVLGCDGGNAAPPVPDWGGGARSPYVPEGYELTFEDDFDRLDLADGGEGGGQGRWISHFASWGVRFLEGNDEKALKVDAGYPLPGGKRLGEHGIILHEVENSALTLRARPTPPEVAAGLGDMPYLGGMISGERLHAQRHGYWEFRARISSISNGVHWAFWLLPDSHAWPPEIDMLEVVGSNPDNGGDANQFFFNSHTGEEDEITRVAPPRGIDAWYTVGFLWTDQEMRWFLDGREVRRRPALAGEPDLYFLVSPEVAGRWTGPPDASTAWPSEVEIDYVRVYGRP